MNGRRPQPYARNLALSSPLGRAPEGPTGKASRACLGQTRSAWSGRAKLRREALTYRPWRKAGNQDKSGRPLFLRATNGIRCGRPCSCRQGWLIQRDVAAARGVMLRDGLRRVWAKDQVAFDLRACSHNQTSRQSRSPTNAPSSFASKDATKVRLRREQTRSRFSSVVRGCPPRQTACQPSTQQALRKRALAGRWQRSPPSRGRSCWRPNHDATNRIPLRLYPPQARSEYLHRLQTNGQAKK